MNRCCPTFEPTCLYGNVKRQYTKTCEYYWLDGQEQTVEVPKDTIFSECREKSNGLALEYAKYQAQELVSCAPCCFRAICVAVVPPEDAQYIEYFTASIGVLTSKDITIEITQLMNCPDPEFGFFTTFLGFGGTGGIVGDGQIKLSAGVIYSFGVGSNAISRQSPELFTLGWDCESECAPPMRSDSMTTFPAGIAQCPDPD